MMREHIWRSLLSVRTFFAASSRGLVWVHRSFPVAAVPRLKKQAGIVPSRIRGPLVSGRTVRGGGFQRREGIHEIAPVRKSGGVFHSVLFPVREKQRVVRILRLGLSLKPFFVVAEKAGIRAGVHEMTAFPKRKGRLDAKSGRIVVARKRAAADVGRTAVSPSRGGMIERALPVRRIRHGATGVSPVVRRAVLVDKGSTCIPPVRKQTVHAPSSEGAGREHDALPAFPALRNYHDRNTMSGDVDHEMRRDDFSFGNRRSRLAARRSGGGVDEIMQPQYPGRSIGFF
ncbi:hypothetical protein [Gluconobacter oxydans]|uniref:Uncharacterized protein n=1 Tax=Gluconobacter oxydans DSM 3504 TaxID=1288313 RepID=A0A067Z6C1_GLUOY|nr:hypothetical protein [Gluconobacter oxydans]AHK71205.1 hypothetical protein GLS_c13080 [Gluconobacter oxydans DSM 3504]